MKKIAVIRGDGIGPEVIGSALAVISSLGLDIEIIEAEMGLDCHSRTGSYLPDSTLETIRSSDACLFGAITTPLSDPLYRSPIIQLRKELDLYANIRPVKKLHPDIGMADLDLVIVRENTEGMYTGVEIEVPEGIVTERKITRIGCQRIVDRSIKVCKEEGLGAITCVHKANVLRRSDGLFREIFHERTAGSGLAVNEMLVDAAAAALVLNPRKFQCLVTLNLYGDILSDEAAALVGGLGLAPSVNMGDRYAIFEPTHGSAPDIAGKGVADPIAAILSSSMMLSYLGLKDHALMIDRAVHTSLGEGARTIDIGGKMSTKQYTESLIRTLDRMHLSS